MGNAKSRAQIQREYRQRVKMQKMGIVTPQNGTVTDLNKDLKAAKYDPSRIKQVHKQDVETRKGGKVLLSEELPFIKSVVFYQQNANGTYTVSQRVAGVRLPHEWTYTEKDKAKELFDQVVGGKVQDPNWYGIEYYKPLAMSLIRAYKKNPLGPLPPFDRRYAFVLALAECLHEGFTDSEGQFLPLKGGDKGHRNMRRNQRRILLDRIGAKPIANHKELVRNELVSMAEMVAKDTRTKNGRIKVGTWVRKLDTIYEFIDVADYMPSVFPEIAGLAGAFEEDTKNTLRAYRQKTSSPNGTIALNESYPPIPLKHLGTILKEAFETNVSLYDYIILGLTTGLRVEELRRLIKYRMAYVRVDRTLNYKHQAVAQEIEHIPLTSKTEENVLRETLANPRLSIIGHIILKHCDPMIEPLDFFKLHNSKRCFRKQFPECRKYVERSMRATCATMLAYTDKAKEGRANIYDVKDRLAHTSIGTASKKYAKNPPIDATVFPEQYFSNAHLLTHKESGLHLAKGEFLWDSWLLRDWMVRRKELFEKERDKKSLDLMYKQVIDEVKAYHATLELPKDEAGASYV